MKRHEMRKIQINTLLRLAVQAGLHDTIFSYRRRQNKGDLPETPGFRNRMLSLLTKNENVKGKHGTKKNTYPRWNRRGLLDKDMRRSEFKHFTRACPNPISCPDPLDVSRACLTKNFAGRGILLCEVRYARNCNWGKVEARCGPYGTPYFLPAGM